MSLSTQTKACPQCRAALTPDVTQCRCGHRLDNVETDVNQDLVTQAEVLYETHLRARLQRATRLTRVAKVDLLRDPTNMAKKAQLREMEKELVMLEKQLDLQGSRIADARAAAQRSMDVTAIETFRAAQSAKAQQSIEANRLQTALNEPRTQASGAFSTAQAGRAAGVVQEKTGMQTCPSCNATVTIGAARCACGYELRGGKEDGEFLSTDDRSALRERT